MPTLKPVTIKLIMNENILGIESKPIAVRNSAGDVLEVASETSSLLVIQDISNDGFRNNADLQILLNQISPRLIP